MIKVKSGRADKVELTAYETVQIGNKDGIMACQMAAGEDTALRIKRMRYRAWHRGTKEMDLMLGPYADARLATMSAAELDRFERLLDLPDTDLLAWLLGQQPLPPDADRDLFADLLAFRTTQ